MTSGSKGSLSAVFVNILSEPGKYIDFELLGINSFASKLNYYFMLGFVKKIIVSLADFNIFHWLILSAIVWTIVGEIYLKLMKLLLQKVGIKGRDQDLLIDSIWQLCFTTISLPMLTCVGANLTETFTFTGNWAGRLDYQLSKCKVHEEFTLPGVKTQFTLYSSYFIYDLVKTYSQLGFKNVLFLQKQLFLSVFVLTYYSKCPLLGLSIMFLLHCSALVGLLSQLFCLLSRFTNSVVLTYLAKALCIYYLLMWSTTFLYNLPMFLMKNKSIDSGMMKAEIKMLIVLDVLIWTYVLTNLFTSTFGRVALSFALPGKDRPRTLEHFLFGCDPWLLQLTTNQQEKRALILDEVAEVNENRRKRDLGRALLQTIHCSIVLKRKLRRMRQDKEKLARENQEQASNLQNREVNEPLDSNH